VTGSALSIIFVADATRPGAQEENFTAGSAPSRPDVLPSPRRMPGVRPGFMRFCLAWLERCPEGIQSPAIAPSLEVS
jgi:hypothetical protein